MEGEGGRPPRPQGGPSGLSQRLRSGWAGPGRAGAPGFRAAQRAPSCRAHRVRLGGDLLRASDSITPFIRHRKTDGEAPPGPGQSRRPGGAQVPVIHAATAAAAAAAVDDDDGGPIEAARPPVTSGADSDSRGAPCGASDRSEMLWDRPSASGLFAAATRSANQPPPASADFFLRSAAEAGIGKSRISWSRAPAPAWRASLVAMAAV